MSYTNSMNYSNNNVFANKTSEIGTSRDNVSKIMNPKIRYLKVDREASMSAPDKVPEAYEQDKRSLASVSAAPSDRKPQNAGVVKPADADADNTFKLDMTKQGLLNGLILSEVLGRPKCFRSRRRPIGK